MTSKKVIESKGFDKKVDKVEMEEMSEEGEGGTRRV